MAFKRKSIIQKFKLLSRSRRKPCPLCVLPSELVEAVASFLDLTDMCAFRLTCKTFREETSSMFWRTALHSMQTDISLDSLGKLQAISTNPQLRHCIEHLKIKVFD